MQRRVNDAQTDRLLAALRSDLSYRQTLAKKIADREGIKYPSAMRRLQRYITEAGEKRSFARAPVQYQRSVRQIARQVSTPPPPLRRPLPREDVRMPPPRRMPEPLARYEEEEYEEEDLEYTRRDYDESDNYEKRAIIAYFDGNTREAGRALGVDSRLLDMVAAGTTISRSMGGAELDAAIIRWFETISDSDYEDIKDFDALLHNLPEWEIEIILDDLADGDTTLADWLDIWRDVDMDFDDLLDNSEWWALWRAAYAKAKG